MTKIFLQKTLTSDDVIWVAMADHTVIDQAPLLASLLKHLYDSGYTKDQIYYQQWVNLDNTDRISIDIS